MKHAKTLSCPLPGRGMAWRVGGIAAADRLAKSAGPARDSALRAKAGGVIAGWYWYQGDPVRACEYRACIRLPQ